MRFLFLPGLAVIALAVAACGGGAEANDEVMAAGSAPSGPSTSITPTTPVPAPPWVTGTADASTTAAATATTAATTVPPTPVQVTPPSPPTATAVPPTPVPTQAPPTATPTPAFPTAVSIAIQDDVRFVPNRTTIAAGGTVTFSWSGDVFHNVSSAQAGFSTDLVKSGSFTFTLASPGTYSYLCEVHPTTMKGIIEVK